MKTRKIIYWVTTTVVSAMMTLSGFLYFTSPDLVGAFAHLGFPDWLRIELGIAKLIGILILMLPIVPARVKEWAYAGFSIVFINAFIAHVAVDDPAAAWCMPVLLLAILMVSYVTFHMLQANKLQ